VSVKDENPKKYDLPDGASRSVEICRIVSGQGPETTTDCVVAERAVTVMVDKVGSFTIMATPSDIEALAVGFIYSEGIIDGIKDCLAVSRNEKLAHVVGIEVQNPTQIAKRNLIVASSCGMCGVRNIEKMLAEVPACDSSLNLSADRLIEMSEKMRSMQKLFAETGGAHAAAIFDAKGTIIAFAEDIGRHSALDKAIGKCLMAELETKGCGVVLSGRVSLEMVTKAARAGIELIGAVSAPSSFAIEAALRWNITVCGFVRPGRMNIYTYPERISDVQEDR
jgi:FdhD protein